MRVSVVISPRDRPRPLADCLQALAASFPADAETIGVSDGERQVALSVEEGR